MHCKGTNSFRIPSPSVVVKKQASQKQNRVKPKLSSVLLKRRSSEKCGVFLIRSSSVVSAYGTSGFLSSLLLCY